MEFRILGSVGIADQAGPVPVGGSKPRLLLAVLLAHRNRVVSSDALVDALWGEHPPPTARTTLSSHISRLRRVAEDAGQGAVHLVATPPGYVLEIPDDLVDAGRFEQLLERGRQLLETDPPASLDLLETALGTWHGDAFAEFAQEEVVYADAVRLEELRLGCREDRLTAMLTLGRHDDVVSAAEALVAEHPLRERAWSQLMLGLTRAGRPAEALRAAERLRGHLAELGLEPSSAVRELEGAILTEQPEATWDRTTTAAGRRRGPASPNNLPLELTTFVGRTRELEDLVALMGHHRLVNLTGVGGVGKSRLALQVAQRLLPTAPDGVFLVELAAIQDPSLIVPTIARALQLAELPGRPVAEALDEHLARNRLVLVIDNCEHLAAEIAGLISHMLRTGPELRVLATSRVRLGVEGEAVWPVPVLGLPLVDDPDAWEVDAVRLFADRARLADADFVVDDEVLPVVGRICRRVEGIPLAIELAAARLGVLTAAQVESRLDDLGHLLAATHGGADPRHNTMRATLDWSHDLLDSESQVLLRRMSVFQGGFDLEGAEAVAGYDPLPHDQILDALHRLIDASLVARSRDSGRYRLLEPVRQFAVDRLRQAGEDGETAGRHARRFAALVAEAHDELRGADQERWFARLDADRDNLALALSWALEHDSGTALAMASGLGGFWVDRGHHTEARRWLRDLTVLPKGAESAEMGLILLVASELAGFEGDNEQATALADRADRIGQAVADPWLTAQSTLRRAGLAWDHGRTGDAVPLYEDAVQRLNRLGSPSVTYALADLGLMLGFMGAFAQAEAVGEALRRAADRFRQPDGHAMLLDHLAVLSMYQGDAETAWKHIELVIPERRRLGVRTFLVNSLRRIMWPAIELGRFDRARAVFEEGMEISREMGYRAGEAGLLIVAARLHLATGELDRARAVLIEGLQLLGGVRRADWTMFGLYESGRVALLSGEAEVAATLHGASARIREHSPLVLTVAQQNELGRDLPELDRRLGVPGRERAWRAGAAMSAVDAGRLALGMLQRGLLEPDPPNPDALEPDAPELGPEAAITPPDVPERDLPLSPQAG